ncbi:MAG: hypothetical protein ACKOFX_09505 [Solirubrobacterales bacterium]
METVYMVAGLLAIGLNLAAGLVGGTAWARDSISTAFWPLLRSAQFLTALYVLVETGLYVAGSRAEYGLHYLYAFLPLVAMFLAEGMRGSVGRQELGERELSSLDEGEKAALALAIIRRETGVMTISCLVVAFLIWRAIETTAGMF